MPPKSQQTLIYCRVSDTKQKLEGSGLESQEYRCRQYAAEKGYEVTKVFHDDVSGGGDYAKRPGMIALLNFLEKNHKVSYIVIFDDLKRLARDTMFHWQLRHAMANFGARLECLNYRFDDSPEGEFMETLFAAQGQLERKQIGRQTRQKTQARLEAGYYAFIAPVGFTYSKCKTQGKTLVKDEPVASIIAQAMEGFASGQFQTQQEVRYFLENTPEFPKQVSGKIGNSKASDILSNPLYAGMIEYPPWGVSLRKGQHEGMVSWETFCNIQARLQGRAHAPARKDINQDFPLRGSVACECGNALTAAWSKSRSGKRHPYYVCQNRQCAFKGKSIRRDELHQGYEQLLAQLQPNKKLITIADDFFRQLWDYQTGLQGAQRKQVEKEITTLEQKIERLLDRLAEVESEAVLNNLEQRIDTLHKNKLLMEEKLTTTGQPQKPFDEMYRTAMQVLYNPLKLWQFGCFELKHAVQKLVFTERLVYTRNGGYRTPKISLPFKVLGEICSQNVLMVPRRGLEPPPPCED